MAKLNIVGHCYRPSSNNDKVYMCCIRQTSSTWTVIAKWGRRGKKLSNQVKGSFSTEAQAVLSQQNLWKDRQKEGYQDIESPEYRSHMQAHGGSPLTLNSAGIQENLEGDIVTSQTAPVTPVIEWQCERCGKKYQPKMDGQFPAVGQREAFCPDCVKKVREIAAAKRAKGEDEVLVCVDNSGMEDRFDVGIEYIVEEHTDKSMVYVYDKMGRKDEYFRIRFTTPEQWARKQGKIVVAVLKNREPVPGAPKIEIVQPAAMGGVKFAELTPGKVSIQTIPPTVPLEPRKHFVPKTSATMPTRRAVGV